ncbi:hypothetical protein ANO11243_031170 [Dothideomycetidae sp. 11243]|nr:hypothetical protein ANO11243_031170 [fungal sp. No.11243]
MEEDEDDLYGAAPNSNGHNAPNGPSTNGDAVVVKQEQDVDPDVDEGDDDDEEYDSDSDIDIITERKDAPSIPSQDFKRVKQEPVRISSVSEPAPSRAQQPAPVKLESPSQTHGSKLQVKDGSKYPEYRSSTMEVDAIAIYDPAGKPITEVDLDADIAMETKPWRVPGTDPTDFFNYGFDEFTWVQYCMKQESMKGEVSSLKDNTKQFEAMLGGPTPQGSSAVPSMPGMPEMGPEMMSAMMNAMQSQGVADPNELDFNMFMQQMQQMGGVPGVPQMPGGGGFGQGQQHGQNQFGGQGQQHGQNQFSGQNYGGGTPQPQQQGQSYDGFSPQQMAMMQQGGGGGGGGGRGRGRGRRW